MRGSEVATCLGLECHQSIALDTTMVHFIRSSSSSICHVGMCYLTLFLRGADRSAGPVEHGSSLDAFGTLPFS